jgi:hypothetical protein
MQREHPTMLAPQGHYHFQGAPTEEIKATNVAMAVATRIGVCVRVLIRPTSSARRR